MPAGEDGEREKDVLEKALQGMRELEEKRMITTRQGERMEP